MNYVLFYKLSVHSELFTYPPTLTLSWEVVFEVIGQTLREDRSCEWMNYFSIAYTVTVQYV